MFPLSCTRARLRTSLKDPAHIFLVFAHRNHQMKWAPYNLRWYRGLRRCCACTCNWSPHTPLHTAHQYSTIQYSFNEAWQNARTQNRHDFSISFSGGWLNCSCTSPLPPLAGWCCKCNNKANCHISSGALSAHWGVHVYVYVSMVLPLCYWDFTSCMNCDRSIIAYY